MELEYNDVVFLIFELDCVDVLIIPPSEVAVLVSGVCRISNSISGVRSCFSNLASLRWFYFALALIKGPIVNCLCAIRKVRFSEVAFT